MATSSLNPTLPNPVILKEILDVLQEDPDSVLLEIKITELGFSLDVVQKLRNDPEFLHFTTDVLREKLEELKEEHLKITTEAYNYWIERNIIDDSFDLFQRILLSQQPEVIRRLELEWRLIPTGNFDSMVENYRYNKYTRHCLHYSHEPNICMTEAARWGHLDVVKEALKQGANSYNKTMRIAAFNGHKEIVEMMLKLGADDYNLAMEEAARNGHKKIIKMMLDRGATGYPKNKLQFR